MNVVNSDLTLSKSNSYDPNILTVDGLSGCGKVILLDLLLSLHNCSAYHSSMILENIAVSDYIFGKRDNSTIAHLKLILDNIAYNHAIGRSSNTLLSDSSSIFKSPHILSEVYKLIKNKSADKDIAQRLNRDVIILLFLHSSSFFSYLYEEAFPKLSSIYLIRDPLETIGAYSKYLPRILSDPREFTPKICFENQELPWFFHRDPQIFSSLCCLEASAFVHAYAYKSLYHKLLSNSELAYSNTLVFDFSDLILRPHSVVKYVSTHFSFSYNSFSFFLQSSKNNVPRNVISSNRFSHFCDKLLTFDYYHESQYWYKKILLEFCSLPSL